MAKITSLADLTARKDKLVAAQAANKNTIINVSLATCSIASGGQTVLATMKDAVAKNNLADVEFKQSGCMCYCFAEPTVEVTIDGKAPIVFGYVDEAKAQAIVEKYIKNGEMVDGIIPVNYTKA